MHSMTPASWHRLLRSRATVWLACACMLMSALAPTLSRALAAAGIDSDMVEVCTSAGLRRIPMSAPVPASDPSQQRTLSLDQCQYCVLLTAASAPPPQAPALPNAGSFAQVLHARPSAQACFHDPRTRALARAPPPI